VGNYRFLVDYESDLKLFDVLFSQLGNDCSLADAFKYLDQNPELKQINANPLLTIYTCVLNGAEFIQDAMDSVSMQTGFKSFEYIIIDDHSTDETTELIAKFSLKHKNVSWYRNDKNMGLASSSNLALKKARGKYILRLDADDLFNSPHALTTIIREIEDTGHDVIYPDNYFGDYNTIQKGNEKHHVGGALFDKAAITHIKFTEGLSEHDSLDVFLRAREQLKIGYLEKPLFFYRQHGKSKSKNNLAKRERIEKKLQYEGGLGISEWDDLNTYFEGEDDVRRLI
jgi:glycosyltransferase involved in cell wall biosynthesis